MSKNSKFLNINYLYYQIEDKLFHYFKLIIWYFIILEIINLYRNNILSFYNNYIKIKKY